MPNQLEALRTALASLYTVERELGRGGMATVYLARDLKHDRNVALKVLRPELAASLGPDRFLREIRFVASLTHPQILPLHDSDECDGFLYYVMPFVEGGSLRSHMDREGRLPVDEALSIARAVTAALDHAHRRDVLHRDIKPENILLQEGQPLVADFGVARAISECCDDLTGVGMTVGTPAYMSPEQAAADEVLDGRSDLYALACVVYEMLTGEPPFAGVGPQQTMARHATEAARPIRMLRADVPAPVEAVLAKALAKDPAHRHAYAREFGEALAVAALQGDPGATDVTAPSIREHAIAVLPLVNASPEPENEYFSDGVTDELINALAQVEGLRVASRTSVFALKGEKKDVRSIAAHLGVSAVLEGTVRKAGNRIRVTVQLTDVSDGRHLWSEQYDRKMEDVFALQED
ncbi:MAG: protein kinase, partial [Gemmatimonadales bacterium]